MFLFVVFLVVLYVWLCRFVWIFFQYCFFILPGRPVPCLYNIMTLFVFNHEKLATIILTISEVCMQFPNSWTFTRFYLYRILALFAWTRYEFLLNSSYKQGSQKPSLIWKLFITNPACFQVNGNTLRVKYFCCCSCCYLRRVLSCSCLYQEGYCARRYSYLYIICSLFGTLQG